MKTLRLCALSAGRAALIVLGWLSISALAFAQSGASGTIVGEVTDAATGQHLEAAIAELTVLGRTAVTDRQGTFQFTRVPAGAHSLSITYPGMDAQQLTVSVEAGGVASANVQLRADVYRMGEFVVVSEREGNAAAIAQQRAAPNLKNVLSTDAYGTVSDDNVGNLLQRLASVSADFSAGDVTYVRVRGISPGLNAITVDGTRMANEDLVDTRRDFRFNQFSIANVEKIEVTKAPTPDMDADAIGGSINLVSKSAFDSKARRQWGGSLGFYYRLKDHPDEGDFDWSLRKRQLSTKLQPTASVFYSDVVGAKKNLGIRFDASFKPRYVARDNAESQYEPTLNDRAYTWQFIAGDLRHVRTIAGIGLKLDYKLSERSGLFAGFKYNYLHHTNEFNRQTWATRQEVAQLDAAGNRIGRGTILPNYTNLVTEAAATADTSTTLFVNKPLQVYAPSRQVIVGGKHRLDDWRIDYDLNVSEARSNINVGDSGGQITSALSGVGWRLDRTGSYTMPSVTQTGGPKWNSLDNYRAMTLTLDDMRHGIDTIVGGQFNARRDFSPPLPSYVKSGVRFRQQNRDLNRAQRVFTYLGPDGRTGVNPATGVDDGSLARFLDTDYNYHFFEGRYPVAQYPSVPAVRDAQRSNPGWFSENVYTTFATPLQNARNVEEKVWAGYLSGNVDLRKLSVLAGVRWEETRTDGEGARRADRLATAGPNETREQTQQRALRDWGRRERASGKYDNLFPSIHAKYALTRDLLLRASWTNSIGRPNYGEIIPNTTVDEVNQTIRVTNPAVKPQYSRNYDVTFEYYIRPAGLLSGGWFRKNIRDFITRRTSVVGSGANNGFEGDYAGFEVSRSSNSGTAEINGYEFNYQQQFTFLPGFWKSFGGFANYTYLEAKGGEGDDGRGGRNELGGFVPRAGNAGLSYIGPRLTLRLQANHRGASFNAPAAVAVNTVVRSAYTTINLSAQYKLNDRWSLYADWINLTSETEDQRLNLVPSRVRTVFDSGPEMTAGVAARF